MQKILACLVLSVSCVLAQAAVHEKSIDASFPDELAGLTFVGRKEFPQKELGVNLAYEQGLLRGSVFIYTAGLRSIPDGADNDKVRKHFDQVIGEVKQMETLGKVRAISFKDDRSQVTTLAGCGPQFLWREYEMTLSEDLKLVSYTYLTGVRDHFVKLRISHKNGAPHGKKDVDRFVSQLRKVIGKCP
ncbi:MAG: hypothetical protein ABW190_16015 [Rhizobacter sp.]